MYVVTGAVISVLAVSAAVVQPIVGRLRDRGRLGDRTALTTGTLVARGVADDPVLAVWEAMCRVEQPLRDLAYACSAA